MPGSQRVKARTDAGETIDCTLEWSKDGPFLTCEKQITSYYQTIALLPNDNGEPITKQLRKRYLVRLKPIARYEYGYQSCGKVTNEIVNMYPPATGSWMNRLSIGHDRAIFFVQEIIGEQKKWLTVISHTDATILFSSAVAPYEAQFLSYRNDPWKEVWIEGFNDHKYPYDEEDAWQFLNRFIDGSSPDWNSISALVKDANIPDFEMKDTLRETLGQLVPTYWEEHIRLQAIAFLGFLVSDQDVFDIDPLKLNNMLWPTGIFREYFLLELKTRYLLQTRIPWISVFASKDSKGHLFSWRFQDWSSVLYQNTYSDLFDEELKVAFKHLKSMIKKRPRIEIAISAEEAATSGRLWVERLILATSIGIRGDIYYKRAGLSGILYIGKAFSWPFSNTDWIIHLSEKTPKITETRAHFMFVPRGTEQEVIEVFSDAYHVHNHRRHMNHNLFDVRHGVWKDLPEELFEEIGKKVSPSKLNGFFSDGPSITFSKKELQVLQYLKTTIYPSMVIEQEPPFDHISKEFVSEVLGRFSKRGELEMEYRLTSTPSLIPMYLIIEGEPSRVAGIIDALDKRVPTISWYTLDDARAALIIFRIASRHETILETRLPPLCEEAGVSLKMGRPVKPNSMSDTLTRIWDDGWTLDLTGLLEQRIL